MGKSKISGGGNINVVNAIVKQYKAYTDDIRPGTFVEFISSSAFQVTPIGNSGSTPVQMQCVVLTETLAVLVEYNGANSTSNVKAFPIVFNPEAKIITVGTSTTVGYGLYARGNNFELIRIDSTRALYVGSSAYSSSYSYAGYACVLTVTNSYVSVGTVKYLADNILDFDAIAVAPGVVDGTFIIQGIHRANMNYVIVSISGTTVNIVKSKSTVGLSFATENATHGLIKLDNSQYVRIVWRDNDAMYTLLFELSTQNELSLVIATWLTGMYYSSTYYIYPMLISSNQVLLIITPGPSELVYFYLTTIEDNTATTSIVYQQKYPQAALKGQGYYDESTERLFIATAGAIEVFTKKDDNTFESYGSFQVDKLSYTDGVSIVLIPFDNKYAYLTAQNPGTYLGGTRVIDLDQIEVYAKPYETKVEGLTKTTCRHESYGRVFIPVAGGAE